MSSPEILVEILHSRAKRQYWTHMYYKSLFLYSQSSVTESPSFFMLSWIPAHYDFDSGGIWISFWSSSCLISCHVGSIFFMCLTIAKVNQQLLESLWCKLWLGWILWIMKTLTSQRKHYSLMWCSSFKKKKSKSAGFSIQYCFLYVKRYHW